MIYCERFYSGKKGTEDHLKSSLPFRFLPGITISEHFGKVASNDGACSLARAVVKGQVGWMHLASGTL